MGVVNTTPEIQMLKQKEADKQVAALKKICTEDFGKGWKFALKKKKALKPMKKQMQHAYTATNSTPIPDLMNGGLGAKFAKCGPNVSVLD